MKTTNKSKKLVNYVIFRPDISSYQSVDFSLKEQTAFAEIEGFQFRDISSQDQCRSDEKIIFISTSQSDISQLTSNTLSKMALHIHPNSGYDNIPLHYVKNSLHPIVVGNTIRALPVANYILSCLFDRYCSLPRKNHWDSSRKWNRTILSQLNVQIIGHGHIGRILRETLSPLVKKIYLFDPYKGHHQLIQHDCDALILSLSLNESSYHMIDETVFSGLKHNVTLINAARGGLIDSTSMWNFLKKNPYSHAYLDVFEQEPMDFSKLADLKNVTLSSHIAGVFDGLDEEIIHFEKNIISEFIQMPKNRFLAMRRDLILQNRILQNMLL